MLPRKVILPMKWLTTAILFLPIWDNQARILGYSISEMKANHQTIILIKNIDYEALIFVFFMNFIKLYVLIKLAIFIDFFFIL